MTREAARTTANVVLACAGVAAAYVVLTTPPLRKIAFAGARWWLGASIPVYVFNEVKRAWMQSASAA
jgi:uncharacterized membrane protein